MNKETFEEPKFVTVNIKSATGEDLGKVSYIPLPNVDYVPKQQTAIEWLFQRFEDGDMYNVEDVQFIKHQAKAMEKEQIVDAHIEGQRVFDDYNHTQWTTDQAEQYYNETYHSVESNEMIDHIGDANKMVCEHSYSRSMNQPYPRKCIKSKEVEGGQE